MYIISWIHPSYPHVMEINVALLSVGVFKFFWFTHQTSWGSGNQNYMIHYACDDQCRGQGLRRSATSKYRYLMINWYYYTQRQSCCIALLVNLIQESACQLVGRRQYISGCCLEFEKKNSNHKSNGQWEFISCRQE